MELSEPGRRAYSQFDQQQPMAGCEALYWHVMSLSGLRGQDAKDLVLTGEGEQAYSWIPGRVWCHP